MTTEPRKIQNEFNSVEKNYAFTANCKDIFFKNVGQVDMLVNGLRLRPGETFGSTNEQFDVLDTTVYRIEFDPTAPKNLRRWAYYIRKLAIGINQNDY